MANGNTTCSNTLIGCDRDVYAKGLCERCYQRKRKGVDMSTPPLGGDGVGYLGMHYRIRMACGNASKHNCSHCSGPAREWAYNYETAKQKLWSAEHKRWFSRDIDDYFPLCQRCHRFFDNKIDPLLNDEALQDILSSSEFDMLLAEKYGVHPSTVSDVRRGKGRRYAAAKKTVGLQPVRERARSADLSDVDLQNILVSNETQKKLAEQYEVSTATISYIKNGKGVKYARVRSETKRSRK